MKVLLVGGGSGGHITPLLAVAHELKALDPTMSVIGVCERNAKFLHLFEDEPDIDEVYQVRAGKYRRYAGMSRLQRMTDVGTIARNVRDVGRVTRGYNEARKLLKTLQPDGILIKGGFVGVPVGLAAAHLKIPFIIHDSDTVPGMANKIIARWASCYATGMPAEFYSYPPSKTTYTGVPVAAEYTTVSDTKRAEFKESLGLADCGNVVAIIGASQGATQINEDMIAIAGRLMHKYPDLGIVHIAGPQHEKATAQAYSNELLSDERARVLVKGFVTDAYRYTGAANVVVSRASATVAAELAVQRKATIMVPGHLAGDHQTANARHLAGIGAVAHVANADREGLFLAIATLLDDPSQAEKLAESFHKLAKPHAARELAVLLLKVFKANSGGAGDNARPD